MLDTLHPVPGELPRGSINWENGEGLAKSAKICGLS